jgi:hypothetical protein
MLNLLSGKAINFEPRTWRSVLDTTLCDKVCQWLATDLWFSPGTPVSSTNKTDRHDITEILLKVALTTINRRNLSTGRKLPTTWYSLSSRLTRKCVFDFYSITSKCFFRRGNNTDCFNLIEVALSTYYSNLLLF